MTYADCGVIAFDPFRSAKFSRYLPFKTGHRGRSPSGPLEFPRVARHGHVNTLGEHSAQALHCAARFSDATPNSQVCRWNSDIYFAAFFCLHASSRACRTVALVSAASFGVVNEYIEASFCPVSSIVERE
jgi:hypothetical protein